jgi:hypothetical protein
MKAKPSANKEQRRATASPEPSRALQSVLGRKWERLPALMFVLGFAVCGAASVLMGQDNNWDLRNYHYYNPFAFITGRIGYDFAPAQRQSYLNPLLDLPFYFGTTYLDPKLYAFLMGGVHGLSFGLLFAISSVVFRKWTPNARLGMAALCAALGLYGPIFIGELGASENDTLITLFVFTPLLLLVRGLAAESASRTGLVVASLIFGMGTGLKPTLAPFAVATALALLAVVRSWRGRLTALLIWSAAFLAGFLITNGFWMAKLWQQFHNPFFPFYNDVFKSQWANISSYADRGVVPKTIGEALARPFAVTYPTDYAARSYQVRDLRYAALVVLLGWIVVGWVFRRIRERKKGQPWPLQSLSVESRFLLIFFVASFVIWQAMFGIFRYAAPLEALAPPLLVVLVCDLTRRSVARIALVTLLFVSTFLAVKPMDQPRLPFGESFWEVKVPTAAITDPPNTLILLANPRPWAYLAAFLPPEVRWVGMNNNLTKVVDQSHTQMAIRALIYGYTGDMFLLSRNKPSVWHDYDRLVMTAYGLQVVESEWWPIESKHSRPGLRLWRLRRAEGAPGGSEPAPPPIPREPAGGPPDPP